MGSCDCCRGSKKKPSLAGPRKTADGAPRNKRRLSQEEQTRELGCRSKIGTVEEREANSNEGPFLGAGVLWGGLSAQEWEGNGFISPTSKPADAAKACTEKF